MSRVAGAGISVEVPQGWEARLYARPPADAVVAPAQARHGSLDGNAVLHVASFALPPGTGDYGGGATPLMASKDLFVILMEHGRQSAATALFAARGIPRLRVEDVSTTQLQRIIEGQGGAQKFFNVNRRAFCLYVVFGSYLRRSRTVPVVNEILGSLTIE